jgi:hypothetical protein
LVLVPSETSSRWIIPPPAPKKNSALSWHSLFATWVSFHAFQYFVVTFQDRIENQSQFFSTRHDFGQWTATTLNPMLSLFSRQGVRHKPRTNLLFLPNCCRNFLAPFYRLQDEQRLSCITAARVFSTFSLDRA